MAIYFVDPYKKYYDTLNSAGNMVGILENASTKLKEASDSLTNISSMVSDSTWSELGVSQLSSSLIPSIQDNHDTVKKNLNGTLSKMAGLAMNTLLPEVTKLKEEDENYEKIKAELDSLSAPEQFDSDGNTTSAYNEYVSKKNNLTTKLEESKKKCEEYKKNCDSCASNIKSLDSNVEEFKVQTASDTQSGTNTLNTDLTSGVTIGEAVEGGKMLKVTINGKEYYVANTKINCLDYEQYVQKNGLHQNAGLLSGECMLLSQYYAVDMLRGTHTTKATMAKAGGGCALRMADYVKSPDQEPVLKYIYDEALAGRPTVLQVTQVRSYQGLRHLVTVVGFDSSVKSYKDLTPDKILVLDCVDGKIQTLGQSRSEGGHARKLYNQGGNYFARGATQEFLAKEVYKTGTATA